MEVLMGKSSSSMGHLYHGYVSHNQRVHPFTSWIQLVCAKIYQAATFAQEKWLREGRPQLVDLAQVGDREENVELVVPTSDVSIMWHIMKDDDDDGYQWLLYNGYIMIINGF